ncbi:MAG: LCP family protein [Ruminococcus sp.]|nr:LCP family protein [Ruminococcus sp.]
MSAKDRHYKPRRFREETVNAAEDKLKKSRSAAKYMVNANEETAVEPGSENNGAPKQVRFPSKVNVPVEEPVSRPSTRRKNYTVTGNRRKPMVTGDDPIADLPRTGRDDISSADTKINEPEVLIPTAAAVVAEDLKKASVSAEPELVEEIAAAKAAEATVADVAAAEAGVAEAEAAETDIAEADAQTDVKTDAQTTEKEADEHTEAQPEAAAEAQTETRSEDKAEEGSEEENEKAAEDKPLDDSLDYVMPYHHEHKGHRHHHRSSHHSSTGISSADEDGDGAWDDNPDDYVQEEPKPKRKKSKVSKVLISILCVILALVVGVVSTFFIMREIGRKKMHNYDKIEINAPAKDESGNAIDTIDATGRVIKYNGVSYAFNDNVVSIAFIGTDEGTDKNEGKEMGDAIYVLAVDAKTGSTKILGISRDTMSDVDVYSDEGKFIDTEKLQMTYAYSFKGTNVTGGQNTLTTISRLFYGLPMNDYFAINLSALKTLNDAIGGVTLTSSMTFESPEDGRTILEGETVTLHGAEADKYVRSRYIAELESNNDRMARQQEYIRAFIASIFPAAKKDISVVSNLYGAIKENSDSTLDITKLTYIASMALSHMKSASDIEYINLSGKIVEGKNAEMYVSNEDAIKTMLDVFYTPMQSTASEE